MYLFINNKRGIFKFWCCPLYKQWWTVTKIFICSQKFFKYGRQWGTSFDISHLVTAMNVWFQIFPSTQLSYKTWPTLYRLHFPRLWKRLVSFMVNNVSKNYSTPSSGGVYSFLPCKQEQQLSPTSLNVTKREVISISTLVKHWMLHVLPVPAKKPSEICCNYA